jgi:hypothetical protein
MADSVPKKLVEKPQPKTFQKFADSVPVSLYPVSNEPKQPVAPKTEPKK